MKISLIVVLAVAAAAASGGAGAAGKTKDAGVARVAGTSEGSALLGTARFEEVRGGLKVSLDLSGVPDGKHALHIHEFGDCSDSGKAAGPHFNPEGKPHGDALEDAGRAHPGDLGNVTAKDGKIAFEAVLPAASLTRGKRSVAGRSIVLHEKADAFTQPAGDAGSRIACGVITIGG